MPNGLPASYTIVGAGKLATALVGALSGKGLNPDTILSRSGVSAAALAAGFDRVVTGILSEVDPIHSNLIILSVQDNALPQVSRQLADGSTDWVGKTVLHTSGSVPSTVLAALAEKGAHTGSFHPIQTFADAAPDASTDSLFRGAPIAVEGDDEAVQSANRLAALLDARTFRVDARAKMLLHIGAVTASNYVVALLGLASEIAEIATDGDPSSSTLFHALSGQAVSNVLNSGARHALTGPISRGDFHVLAAHLERIEADLPELLPIYSALAAETIRLAAGWGTIDHEHAELMLDIVRNSLVSNEGKKSP